MGTSSSSGRPDKPLDSDAVIGLVERAQAMSADDPRRVSASLAMFDRLAEHWSLRADERETLLGGVSKSTWSEWRGRRTTARIRPDTRERIANLFLIDLNAHSLFAPEFADRWVRERNDAFHGESPMTTMLRGKVEDVITVRRYLERIRTSSPPDARIDKSVPAAEAAAVSLLPGEALSSSDEHAARAALLRAVEIYERLALGEPSHYEPVLASVLNAYALCLADAGDSHAETVFRRAIELHRHLATVNPAYQRDFATMLVEQVQQAGDKHRAAGDEAIAALRKLADSGRRDLEEVLKQHATFVEEMGALRHEKKSVDSPDTTGKSLERDLGHSG